jgi:Putative zinc-finger
MSAVHAIEGRPVEDLIIGATDGALSQASQAALRTHLLSCPTCTELSSEHARLAQRLATPVESPAAMRESLARVRQAASAKPRPAWARPGSAIALLAGVSAALVVALLASLAIGESVARLQIPERELVSERSELLGGDRLVLRVEDGRFAATGAQTSGVLISAELTLASPRTGRAELRFAPRGEPYGVLAAVPDLAGATRVRIENRLSQVDALTVVEIWLHLEDGQLLDSAPLAVQIEPSHGGLRARALPSGR